MKNLINLLSRKNCARLFLVLAGLTFVVTFYFTQHYLFIKRETRAQLIQRASIETSSVADQLNSFIEKLKPLVDSAAQKLTNTTVSQQGVLKLLERKPTEIAGFGVAFVKDSNKLSGYYYVEKDDMQQHLKLETLYSSDSKDWYSETALAKKSLFGPFRDPSTGNMIITYAAPFYKDPQEGTPTGVVFATQSVEHLNHILSSVLKVIKGYWFITEKNGTLLSHPNNVLVKENKTLSDLVPNLSELLKNYNNKKPVEHTYENEVTGNKSILFITQLPSVQWMLVHVIDLNELPLRNEFSRQQLIIIAITIMLSLIFLILFLLLKQDTYNSFELWLATFFISLTLAISIGSIWYIVQKFPSYQIEKSFIDIFDEKSIKKGIQPVTSKAELYHFLDRNDGVQSTDKQNAISDLNRMLFYRYKEGKYVPTGLLVNGIHFSSAEQIEFVGLVWQRYFDKIHEGVARGFIFPQLADNPHITEIGRIRERNVETIIWQVRAKLNVDTSYKNYPFDYKNLSIHLWHADFDKNIILVPDLDAYTVTFPSACPGISQNVRMSGWHLTKSYFGFDFNIYTTNFGLYDFGPFGIYNQKSKSAVPELYFNVTAKRNLFNASATDLIGIFLIMFIIFVILLTAKVLKWERVIVGITSAFFTTLLAQIRFRSNLLTTGFVYFESFYFIIYVLLFLVLVVSFIELEMIFVTNPFFTYKKNIAPKLLYWPVALCAILIFALLFLY